MSPGPSGPRIRICPVLALFAKPELEVDIYRGVFVALDQIERYKPELHIIYTDLSLGATSVYFRIAAPQSPFGVIVRGVYGYITIH